MVYLNRVLTPNIPLGADEMPRVYDQLQKVIWDYRTVKDGLPPPIGVPDDNGLYHDFHFEPSIRVDPSKRDPRPEEAPRPSPRHEQKEERKGETDATKETPEEDEAIEIEQIHPLSNEPFAVCLLVVYVY